MSCRAAGPSNELSWAGEGSHKRSHRVGELDELAGLKSLASDDDILAGLINQQELLTGLEKLLKISDASVDKATGLVVKLMGDNAKLHEELDKQKEEAVGWRGLYEKSVTSRMMLTAVVHELGDDLQKLRIERELQVEESVATACEEGAGRTPRLAIHREVESSDFLRHFFFFFSFSPVSFGSCRMWHFKLSGICKTIIIHCHCQFVIVLFRS
jgi:hypothetical protein